MATSFLAKLLARVTLQKSNFLMSRIRTTSRMQNSWNKCVEEVVPAFSMHIFESQASRDNGRRANIYIYIYIYRYGTQSSVHRIFYPLSLLFEAFIRTRLACNHVKYTRRKQEYEAPAFSTLIISNFTLQSLLRAYQYFIQRGGTRRANLRSSYGGNFNRTTEVLSRNQ